MGRWRECEWADGVSKEGRKSTLLGCETIHVHSAAWVRDDKLGTLWKCAITEG